MATKNFSPRSRYQDERLIYRAQPASSDDKKAFSDGAFPDSDPSMVPSRGVHVVKNYRVYPNRLLARGGCKRWSSTLLPSLPGRTGYSLTKSTTTVTKTVGTDFSADDVGNYVVYDDGSNERIEEYLSTTTVRVSTSTAHAASTSAYIRGPKNAMLYHKKKNLLVLFIDTRFFYSDVLMTAWTQIYPAGINGAPVSSISRMRAFDDFAVLFNANGLYKIDLDEFCYWKMNSACPSVRITDVTDYEYNGKYYYSETYARRYVYSMGRLKGTASQTRDRYSSGVQIVQETGTVSVDASGKDFGIVYNPVRFGEGGTYYGKLTLATLTTPYDVPSGFSSISDGHFKIALNGTTYEVACDFTGIVSMAQAAERIETALRDYESTMLCEFVEDHLEITAPEENATVGTVAAPDAGTDISSAIGGAGTDVSKSYTERAIIGELEIPTDPITGAYDSHFDIYCIYSTLQVNEADPLTGELNNDELFVWQADIPVAKAFVASLADTTLTLSEGTFQACDQGSIVRFQDGTEVTIFGITSATEAQTVESDSISEQAAAIGGDESLDKAIRVMTASQSGTTVTRSAGDTFASTDVGRPIFWPDGSKSTIVSYTDANTVTVLESASISSTGACIEPKTRKYCDTIRDNVAGNLPNLRTRVKSYALQNRFFLPMPDCDMGEITANMVWECSRGETIVYYCAADVNYRHQAGYYYASKQREIFQDAIFEISEISNTLSVKCGHSTRAIPINQFGTYEISAAGTAIIITSGQDMVDERLGVKTFSGVLPIDRSKQVVITSEPAIRLFDGSSYGENLMAGRIQKIVEGCQAAYCLSYDQINGVTIWFLEE
jgi:hypothetical protein